MKTSKLLKTIGAVGLLAAAGIVCSKKEPFELRNADYGGNMYNTADGTASCAFYRSDGIYPGENMPNRYVVRNEDQKFDQSKRYDVKGPHLQGKYNISGYTTFLGENVATNIQEVTSN
jgi:hypothetical protein